VGVLNSIRAHVRLEIRELSKLVENELRTPEVVDRECGPEVERTLSEKSAEWEERARLEGAIRDSTHWLKLRQNFQSLADQETEESIRGNYLSAIGDYGSSLDSNGTWIFSGGEKSLRVEFAVYGAKAGIALNAPVGADPSSFWLHHLFCESVSSQDSQGTVYSVTGYIRLACPESATYCAKTQKIALENEHRLAAVPPNSSTPAYDPFQEDASSRPLGDNPFPIDSPAWAWFEEATWKAKTKITRFKVEFLSGNYPTKAEFIQGLLTFRKRWFTATAFEATLIVGNEETASWYEGWIDDRARWLLDDTLTRLKVKDPNADPLAPPIFGPRKLEFVEKDLTKELVQMTFHYKRGRGGEGGGGDWAAKRRTTRGAPDVSTRIRRSHRVAASRAPLAGSTT
jgi:hypothetical protein